MSLDVTECTGCGIYSFSFLSVFHRIDSDPTSASGGRYRRSYKQI